jgi:CheY-like chemotaxis protein
MYHFVAHTERFVQSVENHLADKTMNPVQPGDASPKRVLVVDDNVDAATGIGMLLQVCGHDVRIVHRGRDVLDAALTHDADVVFLDIGLPDMDGYEVARVLRAHPGSQRARLIALSGFATDQAKQRSLSVGFDQHLSKPATLLMLQSALMS